MSARDYDAQAGLYAARAGETSREHAQRVVSTELHRWIGRFAGVEMTPWQSAVAEVAMTGRVSLWLRPRSPGRGLIAEWVAELDRSQAAGRVATVDAVRAWRDECQRMPTPVTSPRAPQDWTDAVMTRTGGAR